MDLDRRVTLIKTLHEKTEEGQVIWERTTSKNAFQVIFPNSSVKIIEDEDNFVNQYYLLIFNSEGELTESLSGENLSEKFPDVDAVLRDLYQKARIIALKADDTIEEILGSLE